MAFCRMLLKCGLIYSHQKDSVIQIIVALIKTRCPHTGRSNRKFRFENLIIKVTSSVLLFSGLFLAHDKHSLSVKTQFHCRGLSTIFTVEYFSEVVLSIYRFKRDNFLSENIIFESKTCTQNGHYFERALTLHHANVTSDE